MFKYRRQLKSRKYERSYDKCHGFAWFDRRSMNHIGTKSHAFAPICKFTRNENSQTANPKSLIIYAGVWSQIWLAFSRTFCCRSEMMQQSWVYLKSCTCHDWIYIKAKLMYWTEISCSEAIIVKYLVLRQSKKLSISSRNLAVSWLSSLPKTCMTRPTVLLSTCPMGKKQKRVSPGTVWDIKLVYSPNQ